MSVAALALIAVVAASDAVHAADVSHRLDDYALFATDRIRAHGLRVTSGDVGVNAGVFDTRSLDAPASTIGADVVHLPATSTCSALFATGIDQLLPACPLDGVFDGPIVDDLATGCGMPSSVPACASGNGVTIEADQTRSLSPGTYGALDVRNGGHLVLLDGEYVFCGARVGRRAGITAPADADVLVVGNMTVGPGATLTPGGGATSGPSIVVSGDRVALSRGTTLAARLCAPAALLIAGDQTQLVGRFAARTIRTGHTTVTGLPRGPVTTTTSSTSSTTLPVPTTSSTSSTTSTSSSLPPTTSTSSTSTSAPPTTAPPTTTTSSTSSTVGTIPPTTTSSSSTTVTSTSNTSTSAPPTLPTTSTSSTSTTASSTSSTTVTPTTSTSTTLPTSVCGNGVIEPGETCDDGNTVDGDSCPSNCRIELCTLVPSTSRVFTVNFTHPQGSDVAGITVLVDYPEGRVGIAGSGGDASVKAAVTALPAGTLGTSNDLDYAIREVIASFSPIPGTRLFTLTFQDCQGATVPTASDFKCRVEDAADTFGLSVDGVTCTVQPG